MSMIQCPECSVNVSDSALQCPSCGVQLRKPKRGFFGNVVKWTFILFNVLMPLLLFAGFDMASEKINSDTLSEAGKAGTVIGAGITSGLTIGLWVFGDIILGLFVLLTRPK